MHRWIVAVIIVNLLAFAAAEQGLPPGVKDTQNPKDTPPTPAEAVKRFRVPHGFEVTLFAGEPHVQQPIAIAFDERGRLWVAECYSYPDWVPLAAKGEEKRGKDRILVFEDADADGRFDKRTVFWDQAYNLTGIQIGYGGVWACCAPHLLFIPDRNRDDVPDAEPTVVLDGWSLQARHNIYNGLIWGPDGWLYGRNGIVADSLVGKPGTPAEKRTRMNCGIWRYHPTRETFEAVCHGTTNPWGLDFNDYGDAFFTNCVIGHLFQAIPGAHYQRMYGQDLNPYTYELLEPASDHLHWGGGHWTSSRGGQGVHSEAGGGHAHSGAMIYLGDNWPAEFRGDIFMCNLHGNRLNRDRLVREGSGYVGKHGPDMLTSDDAWFRGIALDYGADGAVYVTDWADLGECHDNDGVHRSSGRIYRAAYGKTSPLKLDLRARNDAELVELQLHKNDWFVRQARLLLAERAQAGKSMQAVHAALQKIYRDNPDTTRKLRALWALHASGGADDGWLVAQLQHQDEHIRSWAVRLRGDHGAPDAPARGEFERLALNEKAALVRLSLASALQRLPVEERFTLTRNLLSHAEDAGDHYLPLMIWYGIEPAVLADLSKSVQLVVASRIPKVSQFIARRLSEKAGEDGRGLEQLITAVAASENGEQQQQILLGLRRGLQGYKSVPLPSSWRTAYARLSQSTQPGVRESAHLLAVKFGDRDAIAALQELLANSAAPAAQRESALQALVSKHDDSLVPLLLKLLDDKETRGPVLRALAGFKSEQIPREITRRYNAFGPAERQDAVATLASRPAFALVLFDAVEKTTIPAADISVFSARQLRDLANPAITEKLNKLWGQVRQTSAEKKQLIETYKARLTPEVVAKADVAAGRVVFEKTCMQCHALYGQGGKIGPDLTGSDRANLHYVLENLIDPGAVIGRDYQLTNIFTEQGRLISGIIVEETERAVTVQTANERLVLPKEDIETRQVAPVSMMPEGQVERFSFDELRDLIGYLARKK